MVGAGRCGLALAAVLLHMINALAQTQWTVISGGSPITPNNLPYYDPQLLTIEVGDQVRWNNLGGIHNVNGSGATFPGNPQSFYNGLPDGGLWSWTFTFTIPGVYNYHCDGDGHSATQFGTITVVDPSTGLSALNDEDNGLKVFPSPANDKVCVDAGLRALNSIRVITLQGEEVLAAFPARSTKAIMDVSCLASGNYFLLITDAEGRLATKPFVKQ